GSEAGRMVVCPYLCPRRRAAGKASHLVYGANRFPCLPPLERWRVCLLSVHARFLGGGARTAGRPCAAPLLRRLPVDAAGVSCRAGCGNRFGITEVGLTYEEHDHGVYDSAIRGKRRRGLRRVPV